MPKKELDKDVEKHLHNQLVKLGDMIGDGLADEPDGRWIRTEYSRVCRALGYTRPRANNRAAIDEGVKRFLEKNRCPRCQGELKQTRAGAMRLTCGACGLRMQLKRTNKKPSQ